MARTRYIKPATFLDEELADLPIEARYFFAGLWTQADREGRLEDRPKSLKAQILPWDKVDADRLLDLLAPKFIQRYSVDGRRYIWIVKFSKHQNPHKKEAPSCIPAPENGSPVISGTSTGESRPSPMGNGELVMGNCNGERTGAKAPTLSEVRASDDAKALTSRLVTLIRSNDAKAKIPGDLSKWEAEADKLIRIDGRTLSESLPVLEWCQRSDFWKANILSMGKFREKFPTLLGQMKANGSKGATVGATRELYGAANVA